MALGLGVWGSLGDNALGCASSSIFLHVDRRTDCINGDGLSDRSRDRIEVVFIIHCGEQSLDGEVVAEAMGMRGVDSATCVMANALSHRWFK